MKQSLLFHVKNRQLIVTILAALVGVIVFILIYGYQVLVPTNVDWLLTGGDLSQHYLGWEFYRNSAWMFPIGVAGDLAYPHGLAITFMDSIPLFAIPAKLFSAVLPDHFQYFGWWGIASFAAVGSITALIMQRWTRDIWIILASVVFLCMSPIVFQRMFTHTALGGQWIILLGIYAVVSAKHWALKNNVIIWSVILSLSVLIHPYFLVMNVFLLSLSVTLRYYNVKKLIIEIVIPILVAIITTWLIGGFTFTNISGQKLGEAGYDIVAPLSANGWSSLVTVNTNIRGEAFGYFGIGGLSLVVIATIVSVRHFSTVRKITIKHKRKFIALLILCLLITTVALGPKITAGGIVLFHYDIPTAIEKIWAIFRVTARLEWPIYYLVLIFGLFILIRFIKNTLLLRALIILVCVLQMIDILGSSQMHAIHGRLTQVADARYVTKLTSPQWSNLANNHKHVLFLNELYEDKFVTFAQFSVDHNLTLNTGYFARKPTKEIMTTIDAAKIALERGNIDSSTIYISSHPYTVSSTLKQQLIDGYIVTVR